MAEDILSMLFATPPTVLIVYSARDASAPGLLGSIAMSLAPPATADSDDCSAGGAPRAWAEPGDGAAAVAAA